MAMLNRGDHIEFIIGDNDPYGRHGGLVMLKTNAETPEKQWVARIVWHEINDDLVQREDILVEAGGRHDRGVLLERLAQSLLKAGYGRDVAIEVKGKLQATETHLADMRALVFDRLLPKKEG